MKVLVINGPNLNLLGVREPHIYGTRTLDDINAYIADEAKKIGIECEFYQSNCEGELVTAVHSVLGDEYVGCVINAAAYTHYSYVLRDAISSVNKPFIEVHMSNVHSREEFRHTSVISAVCKGIIAGMGENSYVLAVKAIKDLVK